MQHGLYTKRKWTQFRLSVQHFDEQRADDDSPGPIADTLPFFGLFFQTWADFAAHQGKLLL